MDVSTALLALAFGSLVGLSLGTLGAGGSILTVPILVYGLGVPVQTATGTSLAIVGLNAAAGALDYLRRGRGLPKTGLAFGVSGLLGAFGGAWLNHQVHGNSILVAFSLVMLTAAGSLLRRRAPDGQDASFDERYSLGRWLRLGLVGVGVGFLTGFFGVGGGFLIVPALAVVVGLPMRYAIGTSLIAIALNTVWGLLGHLQFGTLDWTLTGLFAVSGLLGVIAGGKLGSHVPEQGLRKGFATLIVGVAIYTFLRSAGALLA